MVTLDINVGVLVHLSGASIGLSDKSLAGSASVGKIDGNYKSVTDQSGIYAGKKGFEINVGKNTDLKGGVISSEDEKDKNKISVNCKKNQFEFYMYFNGKICEIRISKKQK